MILTNRELFLLIICTVFYITLFIMVLQANRRKIQLLQSRDILLISLSTHQAISERGT